MNCRCGWIGLAGTVSLQSRNRPFCLVLSLVAMVGASPAKVMCVGSDGHVAVEPIGHHHGIAIAHSHDSVDGHSLPPFATCQNATGCSPCTDIAIPFGPCTDLKPGESKLRPVYPLTQLTAVAGSFTEALGLPVFWHCEPSITYHTPLCSVVLRL